MRFALLFAASFLPVLTAQSFEVASIRKGQPLPAQGGVDVTLRGGPGTNDPTHVRWNYVCLGSLVNAGFSVRSYQVSSSVGLCSETFDIAATLPESATKEDLRAMWRNLLVERFGMVAKVEKREFDGYELVRGGESAKLQETTLPPEEQAVVGRLENGEFKGAGIVNYTRFANGVTTSQLVAKARTMADLAGFLAGELGMAVVDATGLGGRYDFEFEFAPRNSRARAQDTGQDVVSAMGEALGLRLRKAPVVLDCVVIEKIERTPTEN
jgi:uncharacterized protein (TIGR03435 family)